jgi:hypothetical protein
MEWKAKEGKQKKEGMNLVKFHEYASDHSPAICSLSGSAVINELCRTVLRDFIVQRWTSVAVPEYPALPSGCLESRMSPGG